MEFAADCLSLLELVEVRAGTADTATSRHAQHCLRCRALLATFPDDLVEPDVAARPWPGTLRGIQRPAVQAARTEPGTLWRAIPDATADFAWVVAILAQVRGSDDQLIVAPVFGQPAVPTEQNLILTSEPLGYDAFVDVESVGAILKSQLIEAVGHLDTQQTAHLLALYRSVLGHEQPPAEAPVGAPVLSTDDPRLLAADERRQSLKELWRATDALVDAVPARTAKVDLAELLARHLDAKDSEWDTETLLETSGVDGRVLTAFRRNELDLNRRGDTQDLARIMSILTIPWDEAEPAVRTTLVMCEDIESFSAWPMPLAARRAPGVSQGDAAAAASRRRPTPNRPASTRDAQIDGYLAELHKIFDDLS